MILSHMSRFEEVREGFVPRESRERPRRSGDVDLVLRRLSESGTEEGDGGRYGSGVSQVSFGWFLASGWLKGVVGVGCTVRRGLTGPGPFGPSPSETRRSPRRNGRK